MEARRRFFKQFAGETIAWFEEIQGKPQYRLMDIGQIPDAQLAEMVPQIRPDVEIVPQKERICARLRGNAALINLFPANHTDLFLFNHFNGVNSIGRIAGELSIGMGLSKEESFVLVRAFFLRMVRLSVCIPRNAG